MYKHKQNIKKTSDYDQVISRSQTTNKIQTKVL